MDRLKNLNPAQRDAVLTTSGPLLVLAGAGTGKTRVIIHRTSELIRQGTPPDRILSVTFTNKAAREMQSRTSELLGRKMKQRPLVTTFHSLCVRILREEIEALGYPRNFTIYDRGDQESSARAALRDIRVGQQSIKPGDLLNRISRWKMEGIAPQFASASAENDFDFLASAAYRRYQANLKASAAVDFDDLLLLTNQLFDSFPNVLERCQGRFDHVQIDEYQDTNQTQFRLVEALVRPHRSLCVVGDDDQSIYGWRGAEVAHILNFQRQFPGAKMVRLEENYRSSASIIEMANRLVRHNRDRHEKQLIPFRDPGSEVRFIEYPDEVNEAESVVREIHTLATRNQVPLSDIAILFRTNEQPRVFETELRRAGVKYVLVGGQSFFDRRETRDMLAYLKVMVHPTDEVSLLRIINRPARGIGTATIEKLVAKAVRQKTSLWDMARESGSAGEIPAKAAAAIQTFRSLIERYRAEFEQSPQRIDEILSRFIDEIDYESEISKQYKEASQQLSRSMMLEQFVDSLKEYINRTSNPSLSGFLEETALEGREDDSDKDNQLAEEAIKLMTLHSAKGLEFPRVYMVGMEEGLLPHQRSIDADDTSSIDEERRLAYVGVTRAMDELSLSRAATRRKWGKPRTSIPSRFLYEMRGDGEDE